ncbi:MAG: type II toxin-antitoxin system RelE/ParE family toxin [Myxococcaceae bacterium]|nr:type II toxin-antitoxin system RelE/ParE family toxin [Myxococcaceae bacterium]
MKLRWAPRALRDLDEIWAYIAHDNPVAATRWVERLHARVAKAARMPNTGRVVPEFEIYDVREVVMKGYRILYAVRPKNVLVLTVFEGHKRAPPLKLLLVPEP